jgi:hypothetical protein
MPHSVMIIESMRKKPELQNTRKRPDAGLMVLANIQLELRCREF